MVKEGQFFQFSIHFKIGHLGPKITHTSFCVIVGLLLTKLNHYINDFVDVNVIFLAIQSNITNR